MFDVIIVDAYTLEVWRANYNRWKRYNKKIDLIGECLTYNEAILLAETEEFLSTDELANGIIIINEDNKTLDKTEIV